MAKLLVIEYEEGCGYNCQTTNEFGSWWASRRPFNRAEMQRRVDLFCIENPTGKVAQKMVYSEPFPVHPAMQEQTDENFSEENL